MAVVCYIVTVLYSGISNWLASRIGWPRHTDYIDARMAAAAAYDTDMLTGTTGTVGIACISVACDTFILCAAIDA
jgi:hypothetical protein